MTTTGKKMKRPFDAMMEVVAEHLAVARENQRFNQQQSDKLMIWLVGFCVGGIALIIGNMEKLQERFSYPLLKHMILLLSVSIVSGLIYRIALFYYVIYYQNAEYFLKSYFNNEEVMETDPDEIREEEDVNQVVRRLQIDFGEDHWHRLAQYDQLDSAEAKTGFRQSLIDRYFNLARFAKEDERIGTDFVLKGYQHAFGLSEKQLRGAAQVNNATRLKRWTRIAGVAAVVSLLAFVAVLVLLYRNF